MTLLMPEKGNWVMVDLALGIGASDLLIKFLFNVVPSLPNSELFNGPTFSLCPHPKALAIPDCQCHCCEATYGVMELEDGCEHTYFTPLLVLCRRSRLEEDTPGLQDEQAAGERRPRTAVDRVEFVLHVSDCVHCCYLLVM